MSRYETTLSQDGSHVLTRHDGDVGIAQTLAAMEREAELLGANPGVRFVVFDYRSATMASQSTRDIRQAAGVALRTLEAHPAVVFIGVAPEHIDFGIGRMFQQYVDAGRDPGVPHLRRTLLVRTMEEAEAIMAATDPAD